MNRQNSSLSPGELLSVWMSTISFWTYLNLEVCFNSCRSYSHEFLIKTQDLSNYLFDNECQLCALLSMSTSHLGVISRFFRSWGSFGDVLQATRNSLSVLFLTWESQYLGKTVFILNQGPESLPGPVCISWKFSSSNLRPYIDFPPVPLWLVKSPPWHIWAGQGCIAAMAHNFTQYTGPLFTKKMPSYQYRDSHYKPESVVPIPVRRLLLSE